MSGIAWRQTSSGAARNCNSRLALRLGLERSQREARQGPSGLGYPESMSVAALLLAAGRGERLGGAVAKAFVPLAGKPLLLHALATLCGSPAIDVVLPVVAARDWSRIEALEAQLSSLSGLLRPVAGGAERQDSVRAGLAALPGDVEWVAVHDAARPLVTPEDVERVVGAARQGGAAILAVAVRDTIKRVRQGRVIETPARPECFASQTPQVFRLDLLREALEKAAAEGFVGTDDSQLVERLGVPVTVVPGSHANFKLTDQADMAAAERWLARSALGEEIA
jgi:2-C-methyl-D-erythritol 4-phosphate cytidylyltransferase